MFQCSNGFRSAGWRWHVNGLVSVTSLTPLMMTLWDCSSHSPALSLSHTQRHTHGEIKRIRLLVAVHAEQTPSGWVQAHFKRQQEAGPEYRRGVPLRERTAVWQRSKLPTFDRLLFISVLQVSGLAGGQAARKTAGPDKNYEQCIFIAVDDPAGGSCRMNIICLPVFFLSSSSPTVVL